MNDKTLGPLCIITQSEDRSCRGKRGRQSNEQGSDTDSGAALTSLAMLP